MLLNRGTMKFYYYMRSEIGAVRRSNQDSAFARSLKTRIGKTFFGIVCDGVGGLQEGELASRTVVGLFSDWYNKEFKHLLTDPNVFVKVRNQWNELINRAHNIFAEHIGNSDSMMGTTLSALLIVDGKYFAAQIGDSRIYLFRNQTATQITTDHSYVAELAEKGLMTFDEANVAPNKNILTRCIGNMDDYCPDFYLGDANAGDLFLISSDGFHGGIIASEMNIILNNFSSADNKNMQQCLDQQIANKIQNGEQDNITAIYVKLV